MLAKQRCWGEPPSEKRRFKWTATVGYFMISDASGWVAILKVSIPSSCHSKATRCVFWTWSAQTEVAQRKYFSWPPPVCPCLCYLCYITGTEFWTHPGHSSRYLPRFPTTQYLNFRLKPLVKVTHLVVQNDHSELMSSCYMTWYNMNIMVEADVHLFVYSTSRTTHHGMAKY